MKYLIPLFTIILLTNIGCKKKAVDLNDDYIGEWRTSFDIHETYLTISIDDKSKAHYLEHGPTADEDFKRTARVNNGNLYLGNKKQFNITQAPTIVNDTICLVEISGTWCIVYSSIMILDQETFYRTEEVYEEI